MNFGRNANQILIIIESRAVELLFDYLNQKSRNREKRILSVFSKDMLNTARVMFLVIEHNNSIEVNTTIEFRYVVFYEHRFISISSNLSIGETMEVNILIHEMVEATKIIHEFESTQENNDETGETLRRSKRIRTEKSFGLDFIIYLVEESRDGVRHQVMLFTIIDYDSLTYTKAVKSQDSAFWQEAIIDEIDSIMRNHTWKLVDLSLGSKHIECKWIFKKKLRVDVMIENFKARLVGKGFIQNEEINYFDTYALVARISTITILIALPSIYKFKIHQMDIKTPFLNAILDEEIYMSQSVGFVMLGQGRKVYKLIKSLHGLKQAPKQWYKKFGKTLVSIDFGIYESDKSAYNKFHAGKGVILCLYADDMLIFETDTSSIEQLKRFMSSCFDMKDIREAEVILGIRIIKTTVGLVINQSHYIEKVLKRFNRFDCKLVSTPFDQNMQLYSNAGRSKDRLEYAKIISSLMYDMTCTRPIIAYAVEKLSRYTGNPSNIY